MPTTERLPIFPSRANAVAMKARIKSTRNGLGLLKRKRDSIELRIRALREELSHIAGDVGPILADGYMALRQARFLGADLQIIPEQTPATATAYCRSSTSQIVGVNILSFEVIINDNNDNAMVGLGRGGIKIKEARLKFQEALRKLVMIAVLQHSIAIVQEALRQTNTRMNGIEYVVLPIYVNTERYILNEMDEMEREEFYRLKCSKAKQKKVRAELEKFIKSRFAPDESKKDVFQCKYGCQARQLVKSKSKAPYKNRDRRFEFWTYSDTYLKYVTRPVSPERKHVRRRSSAAGPFDVVATRTTEGLAQTEFHHNPSKAEEKSNNPGPLRYPKN